MSRFTILAGGELHPTPRLRAQVEGTRVIAADSGMTHAPTLALRPELWVGDFDSTSADLARRHADVPREVFPAAKDATDTELAARAAVERGASELVIVGGFGGQSDHAFAHILLALKLQSEGLEVVVTSGSEEAYALLPGVRRIDLEPQSRVSLLAFSPLVALSISGVVWPLDRRHVPMGSTLTVSNIALGPIDIALESGHGAIICYPM